MEQTTRTHQHETSRTDLARATIFLGGMHSPDCPDTIRTMLSTVKGVVEVLITNYIQTPYGVAQIFYDSRQVTRDEVLAKLGSPYWATLIEDKDPRREQVLLRYTEVYVC